MKIFGRQFELFGHQFGCQYGYVRRKCWRIDEGHYTWSASYRELEENSPVKNSFYWTYYDFLLYSEHFNHI